MTAVNLRFFISISSIIILHAFLLLYVHPKILTNPAPYNINKNIKVNLIRSFDQSEEFIEKVKIQKNKSKTIEKKQENNKEYIKKKDTELLPQKIMQNGVSESTILNLYLKEIFEKIEHNKYYPKIEKRSMHQGKITVGFIIAKNGTLLKSSILKKSRYKRLNEAALYTVFKSAPFPALPNELKKDELALNINIVYELK
ncbi:energy transducer TonB [bacterium]